MQYGVASQALPAAHVLTAAVDLAREIADHAAPLSVAISKRLLWEGVGIDLAAFRLKEGAWLDFTAAAQDSKEGTAAFMEKRAPAWEGRVSVDLPDQAPAATGKWADG